MLLVHRLKDQLDIIELIALEKNELDKFWVTLAKIEAWYLFLCEYFQHALIQHSLPCPSFIDDSEYCNPIFVYLLSTFLQYLLNLKQAFLLNPVAKEDHLELNA